MRNIPAAIAADLAEGVTNHAHVWRVTRRDAQIFTFTDHDAPLVFDALQCEPLTGLNAGAVEKSLGLSVDTASMAGALNSQAITEADLERGSWDGAQVELYLVDWTDTAQRVHLFAGRIGEVRRGAQDFEAELRGLQAPLNVAVGRVFSRFCDADLGDARCAKNMETSVFRGNGVVTALLADGAFRADGLEAFAEDWFTRGRLVWAVGGENEVAAHRVEAGDAVLEVLDPPGPNLVLSAAFTIYAGCDKRFQTCRAKFANTLNFRGFPHMPGNDAVQARPVAGDPLDGSSRFT